MEWTKMAVMGVVIIIAVLFTWAMVKKYNK
jgi:hypothetical protein